MADASQREAQKLYENKDYTGALAILNRALESRLPRDEVIGVLDLRVSIYLKLEDRVSARKDATEMVRTNRVDARGYLRLGQLERLTGDPAAAVRWYEHGLKKVPKSDRLHDYITAQHVKTKAVLEARTAVLKAADPFTKLPAEIIEMVVAYLNYTEASVCLSVSKTWQHMLLIYSVLRNSIDFSHVGKGKLVTYTNMKAVLRRSQKAEPPVLVVAKNLTQPAARHLKESMERWIHYTKMQHLEVNYPSPQDQPSTVDFQYLQWHRFQLRTLIFGPDHAVSMGTVFRILQTCDALQTAMFMFVEQSTRRKEITWMQSVRLSKPNLTTLALQGSRRMPKAFFAYQIPVTFFGGFSSLQHLTLTYMDMNSNVGPSPPMDLSSLESLQLFNCSKSSFTYWPILPASLKVIDCTDCCVNELFPTSGRIIPVTNLRVARLSSCTSIHYILTSILHAGHATLTEIDVDFETCRSDPRTGRLFLDVIRTGHLLGLLHLRIRYAMLSDCHVIDFVDHCPKLETVELSSPKITGVFIVGLLTAPGSQVKRLVLKDCTSVSPDTYAWATQRGVVVERSTSEANGGSGRRIHGLD